ncbi:MAG: universal stress protein [Planctomycetia bacterium]|nr:MAG: universal stress protein [Planctomycetia bacterium]
MGCFDRILLPTDFSDLAEHAAPCARKLAEALHSSIHVLHVYTPAPPAPAEATVEPGVTPLVFSETDVRTALDEFVARQFANFSPPVVQELVFGSPVSAITQYARSHGIGLIVIGTHARGVVNRIFFGSVSKAVMEQAGCPVLMVPLAAQVPSGE